MSRATNWISHYSFSLECDICHFLEREGYIIVNPWSLLWETICTQFHKTDRI